MLERLFVPARTRPARPRNGADRLPGGLSVRLLPPTARLSLRLRGSPAPATAIGDVRLDQPINRAAEAGDTWSARLGPDEWLIGCAEADVDQIQQRIETSLSNAAHALVDVSHRNVAFEIAGPQASAALNAGCPLDLGDAAFPAGTATRTLLGKAEVVLIRPGTPSL